MVRSLLRSLVGAILLGIAVSVAIEARKAGAKAIEIVIGTGPVVALALYVFRCQHPDDQRVQVKSHVDPVNGTLHPAQWICLLCSRRVFPPKDDES